MRARHAAGALVLLAACSLPDSDYFGVVPSASERDPHVFRWCNFGDPDFLDPALASSTASTPLVSALFDGLTAYGSDGNPVASLATSWDTSDDLRTFTFHLRGDARWSSGRALTAYDVAYTAIRVLDASTASPNADNDAPIVGALDTLARRMFVLRRDVAPYHAGDVVELADPAADPPDDPNRRTASRPLALRDLGAAPDAAYAQVPAGEPVTLVMTSGGHATLPTPRGDAAWAYVDAPHGGDELMGWVPAAELDGEPAADVAFAIRGAGTGATGAVATAYGRELVRTPDALGIRVPDARTIIFHTADPAPFFIAATANRALRPTPIEAVSRSPRHWTDPERIVTSGPMHLAAWRRRDAIDLVRSPTYWDQAAIASDRIHVLAVDDQAAATNLYYTAACDATTANLIPSTYLPVLDGTQRGRPYLDYQITPSYAVYFVWVNTKHFPNRHLRRALSLAIDRTQIPRFTHGHEIPSAQLTPGTPIAQLTDHDLAICGVTRDTPGVAMMMAADLCYVPPPGLDLDLDAAKREIALARQELGDAFPATIDYRYNAGSEAHKQIAEFLQASWARIGVTVTLSAQDFNSMLADSTAGNYDLLRFGNQGSVADPESDFLPIFRCASASNRGTYCSPEFERLLDEARPIRDRHARNDKLREAEAVMIDDAPVIPLAVYTLKTLVKPYVHGYVMNPIAQPLLWRASVAP